ncbi:MAG: hypothetical protein AAGD10_12125 [Myxococcota bacterium]
MATVFIYHALEDEDEGEAAALATYLSAEGFLELPLRGVLRPSLRTQPGTLVGSCLLA